ncbi:MAG: hypothetical protein ACLFU9_03370 [Candidatus Bathyarchaeia archaeon]
MNQFDWERAKEDLTILDVKNAWAYNPSGYVLGGSTSLVSGSISDLKSNDGVYMVFRSYSSATSENTLYAHSETVTISSSAYYLYKIDAADGPATNLATSMATTGRHLWGRFIYSLSGISSIPSSTWTFYYRAWRSEGSGGSPEIVILRPNAAGNYTEWTTVYPEGSEHWEAVEDVTPDDDATYIETATSGHRDTFRLPNIPSGAVVSSVSVYARARGLPGPSASFNIMIRTHNTDYFSNNITPDPVYGTTSYTWTSNPYTGTNWTVGEVNDLEIGIRCSSARSVRATQVYAEVTYDSSSPSASGHADVDVLIRKFDGSVRQTIATNVADSGVLTETEQTFSTPFTWLGYTVVDQTDYLEIAYYCHVITANPDETAYLRIDDNTLAEVEQTRVANVILPSEHTVEVEFTGSSNLYNWSRLVWTLDSSFTAADVDVTLQLYNYNESQYASSGDGYIFYVSSSTANTDELKNQTITTNPTAFRDSAGNWKLRATAVKETSVPFDFKVDWIEFKPSVDGTFLHLRNDGAPTSRLVSLWTINSTHHKRYDIDIFMNSGENLTYLLDNVNLPNGEWIVKVVTERGNIAVYSSG